MDNDNIEVLAVSGNCAVVRRPPRKFPGILLQGDTVKMLQESLEVAVGEKSISEMRAEVSGVIDLLGEYLSIYEDALRKAGMQTPYRK